MKKLTTEDFLMGRNKKVPLFVEKLQGEVVIHSLGIGDLAKVRSVFNSVSIRPDGTLDTSGVKLKENDDSFILATYLGLVEPKPSLDQVAQWDEDVVKIIGMKVLELSGLGSLEENKKKE